MSNSRLPRNPILPVSPGEPRPRWSVMIPTYNCADFLKETLKSVLAQDPGPEMMQIQVVDDYSTLDNPERVVAELGLGRVEFYRQPSNQGYIHNFTTCLHRSRGELVHLLHGNDCVRTGFYEKINLLFERYPEIGAAFSRQVIIDDNGKQQRLSPLEQPSSGILDNWLPRISASLTLQTPAMVVRREVYEKIGTFDNRMKSCGEDWEMWVRISCNYPVAYEIEPLALYRDRSNSLTKQTIRTGQNIKDVRKATAIIRAYLPSQLAPTLSKEARKNWSEWAFCIASQMVGKRDYPAVLSQVREGLLCSFTLTSLRTATRILIRMIKLIIRESVPRS